MLKRMHCWICETLCGHLARPRGPAGDPPPLRQASHDLANAVMRMKSSVQRLREEADEIHALASTLHNGERP